MIARHTCSVIAYINKYSVLAVSEGIHNSHCEENRNSKGAVWVTSKMRCLLRILQLIVSRQGGE